MKEMWLIHIHTMEGKTAQVHVNFAMTKKATKGGTQIRMLALEKDKSNVMIIYIK